MNHHKKDLRCRSALAVAVITLAAATSASAGTAAYRGVILGDNPIVYYELDETSGTTAANSATTGATYTGTFNTAGGPITVNQASFAQGGTAYDFGGGFVGAASALTSSLAEWTVEAWVNYDSAKTGASNFLSNDQGGWNNDVLIGVGPENGSLGVPGGSVGVIQQGAPGSIRDAAGAPLAAGEWHHVAVTGSTSAGALRVFIDGVEVASDINLANGVTFNGADGIGTANLTVGAARPNAADGGYRPYDGLLDEVAIYDSVLDAATILAHYNVGSVTAGVPPVIASLVPADDANGAETTSDLVATFNQPVVLTDHGTVTIRNLTLGSGSDTVITLPDPRVTVSGSTLTINPTADLDPATSYAVRITADAIEDADGDAFAGLLDDDAWNFMTAALPGLVGKWEFESEAGGVTPDSSGNGHDGTLEGNANLTVDAERGSVLELSGLGAEAARINIDSTVEIPPLPAGRGATLAAWIKRNADTSAGDKYAYPIGIGQSGNFPIITIGIADATGFVTGFIEGDSGGNDQVEVIGDSAVADGVWTHIAITYDRINNEAITYVNGVAQGTATDISVVGDGALDWGFGVIGMNVNGSSTDANHFGGLVDDVCYFDKVLTPEEIQALAAGLDTFATWIGGFDVGGLTGFEDDPDGDGQGNGLENFLGTDPDAFSSGLIAGLLVGGNTFGFTHPQNADPASDITEPAYEWSKDLVTWNADGDTDIDGTKVDFAPSLDDPVEGMTTVTATVSGTASDKLFMRVSVSQILPPPPLLSESFDAAAVLPTGWVASVVSGTGTVWEVGDPTGGYATGPVDGASSNPYCAGTNITTNGGEYTPSVNVTLTSPEFAVPEGSGAVLRFRRFIDTDLGGDLGSVRVLDAGTDTLIGTLEITGIGGDGTGASWSTQALALPVGEVGGKTIQIEFQFVSDDNGLNYGGFYIDDVEVTPAAP
jgi:hypothetical protein